MSEASCVDEALYLAHRLVLLYTIRRWSFKAHDTASEISNALILVGLIQ